MHGWFHAPHILEQAEQIRKSIGARAGDEFVRPEIAGVVSDREKLLAHLDEVSGLILDPDRKVPVMLYIVDHRYEYEHFGGATTSRSKRLHFMVCEKLLEMKEKRRMSRYYATNSKSREQHIEEGQGRSRTLRLRPCKYCMTIAPGAGASAIGRLSDATVEKWNAGVALDRIERYVREERRNGREPTAAEFEDWLVRQPVVNPSPPPEGNFADDSGLSEDDIPF